MSTYNQSYGLATTPAGRNSKFGWYKILSNHDIQTKKLHLAVLLIGG